MEKNMNEIINLYCNEKKSIREIATITGIDRRNISNFLKDQSIVVLEPCKFRDLTNQSFGDLTAISRAPNKKRKVRWNCACKCGRSCVVSMYSLTCGEQISCGRCKTYKDIVGHYWCRVRSQAKHRNLEFSITIEEAWDMFESQNGKCAISDIPICLAKNSKELNSGKQTASLDRIDSKKGYTKDNLQWVHKNINFMKQEYEQNYFIETCCNIAKKNLKNSIKLTILITGCCGFIGNVLTKQLLENYPNCKIIGYDNLMYKQTGIYNLCTYSKFDFINDDVRNTEKLVSIIKKADVIFPLAGIVGFPACARDPWLAQEINYHQIVNICKNISKEQLIILPQTNSGYGTVSNGVCTETTPMNPISIYGKTKCMAEDFLLNETNGISLRLATVFGISPRMRLDLLVNDFTYKAVHDGYIVLFEKEFKRNFIHINDVCRAFMWMMDNYANYKNNVFNVGLSKTNITKLELCQKIKQYVPNFVIKSAEIGCDPDKRNYIVSNEKLESTGFSTHYTLDDGIKELIKACNILKTSHSNCNI